MSTLITPAELALELGTDARTTRKFLRSITPRDEQPGEGRRAGAIKGDEDEHRLAQESASPNSPPHRRPPAPLATPRPPPRPDDDADAEMIDDDALEPTDAELAAIESDD